MAVLVECTTVIVRNAAVESRFPGGLEEYERQCPNSTYCSDQHVCRVAFMVPADAEAFVQILVANGLRPPSPDGSKDVVVVDQNTGCLQPCDWLETDLRTFVWTDGCQFGATIAWLKGEESTSFVAPPNWKPGATERISIDELNAHYDFVGVCDGVETYRHRETGQEMYVGRPQMGSTPKWAARHAELADELNKLEHGSDGLNQDGFRARLCAFCEKAEQLVSDTDSKEPGPFVLLGIASRLQNEWEAAEAAFRQVTELNPGFVGGWLELTWALGALGRLDDAESSARRAVALGGNRADTLGNLAAVQLQRGDLEAAMETVRRAIDIDPSDAVNQNIMKEIRRRQPWHKKLFG